TPSRRALPRSTPRGAGWPRARRRRGTLSAREPDTTASRGAAWPAAPRARADRPPHVNTTRKRRSSPHPPRRTAGSAVFHRRFLRVRGLGVAVSSEAQTLVRYRQTHGEERWERGNE